MDKESISLPKMPDLLLQNMISCTKRHHCTNHDDSYSKKWWIHIIEPYLIITLVLSILRFLVIRITLEWQREYTSKCGHDSLEISFPSIVQKYTTTIGIIWVSKATFQHWCWYFYAFQGYHKSRVYSLKIVDDQTLCNGECSRPVLVSALLSFEN